MVLDSGTAVLASRSSSDGKSPVSGSGGSSLIGRGSDGREGGDEMSWVGSMSGGGFDLAVLGMGM